MSQSLEIVFIEKSTNDKQIHAMFFVERSHLIELCAKVIFRRRYYALNENKDWKHRIKMNYISCSPKSLVIDATAKIPSGILELKLHWPGSYQLCENVFGEYNSSYTRKEEAFTGKYCRIDIGFEQTEVNA